MVKNSKKEKSNRNDADHGIKVAWLAVNPTDSKTISRKQLLDAIHFVGLNPTKKMMRDLIREQHRTENEFTIRDLHTFVKKIPPTTADDLIGAFQIIDSDGDGQLSQNELQEALMNYGERMTTTEVQHVMTFDTDNSGSIDYKEFCSMCLEFGEQIRKMRPCSIDDAVRNIDSGQTSPLEGSYSKSISQKVDTRHPRPSQRHSNDNQSGSKLRRRKTHGEQSTSHQQQIKILPLDILKDWHFWKRFGRLQAQEDGPPSTQIFSFQISKKTKFVMKISHISSHVSPTINSNVGIGCLIVKKGTTEIIAASQKGADGQIFISQSLSQGRYLLIPVLDPPNGLKTRKEDLSTPESICIGDDGNEMQFTEKATLVLDEIFASFDTIHNGKLSRTEYNSLLQQTDGEPCEDDVWEYILEHFDVEDGELTRRGFFQIYKRMVADEPDDASMYVNFQQLGFNRALDPDEVILWLLELYVPNKDDITDWQQEMFDGNFTKDLITKWVKQKSSTSDESDS